MLRGASFRLSGPAVVFFVALGADGDVCAAGKVTGDSRNETTKAVGGPRDAAAAANDRGVFTPEHSQPSPDLQSVSAVGIGVEPKPLLRARQVFDWNASGHLQHEYRFGSDESLRAGLIDESPREPGAGHRPDAGLGYRPSEAWNVELGYVHTYHDMLRGVEPVAPGGSPLDRRGEVRHLLGISGSYRFGH